MRKKLLYVVLSFLMAVLSCTASCASYNQVVNMTGPRDQVAVVGRPFSANIIAHPYNTYISYWSTPNTTVPPGMTFGYAGSQAWVMGTPTTVGTYHINAFAYYPYSSSIGNLTFSASWSFTITVKEDKPDVTGSLPEGLKGSQYSSTLTAGGLGRAPYTWSIASGDLPPGLALRTSGDNAVISGKPTEDGKYSFAVAAKDSLGKIGTKIFSVFIRPVLIEGSLSGGKEAETYSSYISVKGGTSPFNWKVCEGSLPAGLSLSSSGNKAVISGTPSLGSEGTYTFTLEVTDAKGKTGEKECTIAISNMLISGDFAGGTALTPYSKEITAAGGKAPYTWTVIGGFLPAGLSVTSSGSRAILSGTPISGDTYKFTLMAKDAKGRTAEKDFSVKITGSNINNFSFSGDFHKIYIRSSLLDTVYYEYYDERVNIIGGKPPYNVSFEKGTLPSYLTLVSGDVSSDIRIYGQAPACSLSEWFYNTSDHKFTLKVVDAEGRIIRKEFNIRGFSRSNRVVSKDLVPIPVISGDAAEVECLAGKKYTRTLTASGGTSPYTWSVAGGTLPSWATLTKSGNTAKITWTAQKGGQYYNFTVKVKDAKGTTNAKTLIFNVIPAPTVTGKLSTGVLKAIYSGDVKVNGGKAPYTWSISAGSLPAGLRITASGDKGIISGTPTASGQFSFTLKVADKNGTTATKAMNLTITKPAITATLSDTVRGSEYSARLRANGGTIPYNWSLSAGKLPDGLRLTVSSDKPYVTGKPTKAGNYTFTLKAADKNNAAATKTYTVKVTQTTITGTLTNTTRNASYSRTLTASGGAAPYVWTKAIGTLPPGLTLNRNTGKLSGKPTKAGTYTFTVKVADRNSIAATKAYTVKVTQTTIAGTLTNTTRNASYSRTLTASGGATPYIWTKASGTLPPGLTLNRNTGKLSGKPTKAGTYTFTLKVTDKNNVAATKAYTVKVTQTTIAGTLINTTRNASYSRTLTASGGAAPYIWTKASGTLPTGLTLNRSTGKLSGKPTKAGTYTFTLKVTDKNNVAATKTYTVKVTQTTIAGTLTNTTRNASYNRTLTVSGGASPYIWTKASGTLPPGLTLNRNTGKLSGKPTKAGTYTFTVKVTDKNNVAATKAYTVKVTQTTISGTLTNGIRKASYSRTLKASGGATPYTWTKASGTIPPGLTLNRSTGKLSGKPTRAGTYTFTVKATDKNKVSATKSYTVKVTQTTITGTLTNGVRNSSYSRTLSASGGTAPYTWTISSGTLPPGLTLNRSTGKLSGRPTRAGTYMFTVKAKDKNGAEGTKSFTVRVTEPSLRTVQTMSNNSTATTNAVTGQMSLQTQSVTAPVGIQLLLPQTGTGVMLPRATLQVKSDDVLEAYEGRDSDLVKVKANKPVTFIVGDWGVNVSSVTVYVDDKVVEGVAVSGEGVFTLPAEMVHDDFKVTVKAWHEGVELEAEELYIISE